MVYLLGGVLFVALALFYVGLRANRRAQPLDLQACTVSIPFAVAMFLLITDMALGLVYVLWWVLS